MIPPSLRVPVSPDDSFDLLTRKILAQQWYIVHEHLEHQRFGLEPIHEMRVATRRMRTWLRHCESIEDEFDTGYLKSFAREQGAVRDLDTCIRTFQQALARLGDALQPLIDRIEQERTEQRERAVSALQQRIESPEHRAWCIQFSTWLHQPGMDESAVPVDRLIGHDFMEVMTGKRLSSTDSKRKLHKHRIRCKYLRYDMEFLQPYVSGRAKPLYERALRFQNVLGVVQDHHRDVTWLRAQDDEFFRQCKAEFPDELSRLSDDLNAQIDQATDLFFHEWGEFILPENQIRYEYLIDHGLERTRRPFLR